MRKIICLESLLFLERNDFFFFCIVLYDYYMIVFLNLLKRFTVGFCTCKNYCTVHRILNKIAWAHVKISWFFLLARELIKKKKKTVNTFQKKSASWQTNLRITEEGFITNVGNKAKANSNNNNNALRCRLKDYRKILRY